jgi:hypothetical protein
MKKRPLRALRTAALTAPAWSAHSPTCSDTRQEHHPAALQRGTSPRHRPLRLPHLTTSASNAFPSSSNCPHSPNPHLDVGQSLQIPIARPDRAPKLSSERHRIDALAFLNLFLKCASRFSAGCLLAADLRFHNRLFGAFIPPTSLGVTLS